jgi:predicted nucleic acid binding AN1-type Zn finger protein
MDTSCRCHQDNCNKKTELLGFTCKFCQGIFCCKHRLPESHMCDVKKSAIFEKLKKNCMKDCASLSSHAQNGDMGKGRLLKF